MHTNGLCWCRCKSTKTGPLDCSFPKKCSSIGTHLDLWHYYITFRTIGQTETYFRNKFPANMKRSSTLQVSTFYMIQHPLILHSTLISHLQTPTCGHTRLFRKFAGSIHQNLRGLPSKNDRCGSKSQHNPWHSRPAADVVDKNNAFILSCIHS